MSRHRNIRNIKEYDDEYGDPDDWDDRSLSNSPDIPTEYLPPPPEPMNDVFSQFISKRQEEDMLRIAVEEVRTVLGETYSKEEVSSALERTDYDCERAVELLMDNPPGTFLQDGGTKNIRFQFDEPSPDDVVASKREGGQSQPRGGDRSSSDAARPTQRTEKKPDVATSTKSRRGEPKDPAAAAKQKLPQQPAPRETEGESSKRDTSAAKATVAVKQREKELDLDLVDLDREHVSVVVAGHVDAGKSTLIGQMLSLLGDTTGGGGNSAGRKGVRAPQGHLAWLLDEDPVERERGVTIDVGVRHVRIPTSGKVISLVDSPGHRDFVPMMIFGASMASAAVLVVDSTTGEFEAGFSAEGQTREHAQLLRSMGIFHVVVACNKLDTVQYDEERFRSIQRAMNPFFKQIGFKVPDAVQYIPCSGLTGDNVVTPVAADHPLAKWYKGPTLIGALSQLGRARNEAEARMPTRFLVTDAFRNHVSGTGVTGRLLSGTIAAGDRLLLLPQAVLCTVKVIKMLGKEGQTVAVAGDSNVTVSISGVDISLLSAGTILCDPTSPCPVVTKFQAQIVVMNTVRPILQGCQALLHVNGISEAATITKLVELVDKSKGVDGEKKARVRHLVKNQRAVVELSVQRGVCMETFSDLKSMGRFLLRDRGKTIAAGIVEKVLVEENSLVK